MANLVINFVLTYVILDLYYYLKNDKFAPLCRRLSQTSTDPGRVEMPLGAGAKRLGVEENTSYI